MKIMYLNLQNTMRGFYMIFYDNFYIRIIQEHKKPGFSETTGKSSIQKPGFGYCI